MKEQLSQIKKSVEEQLKIAESIEALGELRHNSRIFASFNHLIKTHWSKHNTLVGFAMDHGCHEIDGGCGSHGLDMDEDLNIVHLYKAYKAE